MSELIEGLRSFATGCRRSMWQSRDETIRLMEEAADALSALQEQNRALRGLVEKAYMEGYGAAASMTMYVHEVTSHGEGHWRRSAARASTKQEGGE